MTRAMILVAAMVLTACAGSESITCQPGTSAAGTWTVGIEGVCSGGTLTVAESAYAECSEKLTATWECGSLSGTTCAPVRCGDSTCQSFRFEDYMELALCSTGGQRFSFTGSVGDTFTAGTLVASR